MNMFIKCASVAKSCTKSRQCLSAMQYIILAGQAGKLNEQEQGQLSRSLLRHQKTLPS